MLFLKLKRTLYKIFAEENSNTELIYSEGRRKEDFLDPSKIYIF